MMTFIPDITKDDTRTILRVKLLGGLHPLEISDLFYQVTSLYNLLLYIHSIDEAQFKGTSLRSLNYSITIRPEFLKHPKEFPLRRRKPLSPYASRPLFETNETIRNYDDHFQLDLRRINYNSPGAADLLGIGKLCEVIANAIAENRKMNLDVKKYKDGEFLRELEKYKELEKLKDEITARDYESRIRELKYNQEMQELLKAKLDNLERIIGLAERLKIPLEPMKVEMLGLIEQLNSYQDQDKVGEFEVVNAQ